MSTAEEEPLEAISPGQHRPQRVTASRTDTRTRWLIPVLAVIPVVVLLDLFTGNSGLLLGLLVAAPIMAAFRCGPVATLLVTALDLAVTLGLGLGAGRVASRNHAVAAATIVVGGGIAAWASRLSVQSEADLQRYSEHVAPATGERFFESLVLHIARTFGASHAYVGRLSPDGGRVITLAAAAGNRPGGAFEYPLKGTPCESVMQEGALRHYGHVRKSFPLDHLPAGLNVDNYVGVPLRDSAGRPLGILVALGRKRFRHRGRAESMLRLCAARAAAELERARALEALARSETETRAFVAGLPDPVLRVRRDGTIVGYRPGFRKTVMGPDAFLGRKMTELGAPQESVDRCLRAVETALETGQVQTHEYRLEVDGSPRDFEARIVAAGNDEVLLFVRDVSVERQAQQSQRTYLALLEAILESSSEGILAVHPDGRFVAYNREFWDMWRLPKELESSQADNLALPSLLGQIKAPEAFERRMREVATGGTASSLDILVLKDGRTVECYSQPCPIGDGTTGRVFSFRDATARIRMEESLRASQERLRYLLSSGPALIFSFSLEGERPLTYVSENVRDLLGYRAEDYVGDTRFWHTLFLQEDIETRPGRVERLLGQGRANYEIRLRHQNGSMRWMQIDLVLVRDAAGRPREVIGSAIDVTGRKEIEAEQAQLQAEIAKSAREWQLTFDAVESLIVILDTEGRILRMNRAAQEMVTPPGIGAPGDRLDGRAGTEPWNAAAALARMVRETRGSASQQASDEQSHRTWDIAAGYAPGAGQEEDRIILVAREITHVVELQQTLLKTRAMTTLGSLVAGVAHEVRNPLFTISASLDAFEARFSAARESRRYISNLRTAVARLSALMQQLLDYGKPAGQEPELGPIGPLVAQAVDLQSAAASGAGVRVKNQVTSDLPPLLADRNRMVQVFSNLIENAIQHSPAGETVTVEAGLVARNGRRWIRCCVTDRGPGVQAEDLPRLFEPFYSRRHGGTGLGLSIVQRYVEEHGGQVSAANRPEGGLALTIHLPVAAENP